MSRAEVPTVLIATDGSASALQAVEFAAAVRWPPGSTLEVFRAAEPVLSESDLPPDAWIALQRHDAAEIDADLEAMAARLSAPQLEIRRVTRQGRAADLIVDEAARVASDLIIVGSRGRGPITTMLLGSVAAEVVDRAPCAVLVARGRTLGRAVLAYDGSPDASRAVRLVAELGILRTLPTRVVSVARMPRMAFSVRTSEIYAKAIEAARAAQLRLAGEAMKELAAGGVAASADARVGDPAEEIVCAMEETQADLIVLGSRGHAGFERLVLGSVARNVLLHAPSSVLIVRSEHRR